MLTKIMIGLLVWWVMAIASFPVIAPQLDHGLNALSGTARAVAQVVFVTVYVPALGAMYASEWYFDGVVRWHGSGGLGGPDEHRYYRNSLRRLLHLQPLPP